MHENYKKQVTLLLRVLPIVAKEKCFVLHGGTAINLFVLDMPRLSVDIDLTYIPIKENRSSAFQNIEAALLRIKCRIEKSLSDVNVVGVLEQKEIINGKKWTKKLNLQQDGASVKIEVSYNKRGIISNPMQKELCANAQNYFKRFVEMPIMHTGQLYGGKIHAALDRQHPRDLFDVKLLLDGGGVTDEIREGFIYSLVTGDRPIHETIVPNCIDQKNTLENKFIGMSDITFTYDDFEKTRKRLIRTVKHCLTEEDKTFLLSIDSCSPNWDIYNFENFPAVQWKLKNLCNLKRENCKKHSNQHEALIKKLN